jgi:hypothetical protein
MALPIVALPRSKVTIGGTEVEYRALSRAEAMQLNEYKGREDEAELLILQWGTGCSAEEAKAFRDGNDTETAGLLIDGIIFLSKLAKVDVDGNPQRREGDTPIDPKRRRSGRS